MMSLYRYSYEKGKLKELEEEYSKAIEFMESNTQAVDGFFVSLKESGTAPGIRVRSLEKQVISVIENLPSDEATKEMLDESTCISNKKRIVLIENYKGIRGKLEEIKKYLSEFACALDELNELSSVSMPKQYDVTVSDAKTLSKTMSFQLFIAGIKENFNDGLHFLFSLSLMIVGFRSPPSNAPARDIERTLPKEMLNLICPHLEFDLNALAKMRLVSRFFKETVDKFPVFMDKVYCIKVKEGILAFYPPLMLLHLNQPVDLTKKSISYDAVSKNLNTVFVKKDASSNQNDVPTEYMNPWNFM